MKLIALAITLSTSLFAAPGPFCQANGFNLFAIGNVTHFESDTEGRVAVGGESKFRSYQMAVKAACPSPARRELTEKYGWLDVTRLENIELDHCAFVSGGKTSRTYGTYHGIACMQGPLDLSPEMGTQYGGVYKKQVLDFAATAEHLKRLSAFWAGICAKGVVTRAGTTLVLTGTAGDRNVFSVDASDLNRAGAIEINVPAGSTALVNVFGRTVEMTNFGMKLKGVTKEMVVVNLVEARTVTLSAIGFQGTLLAPLATVDFRNGLVEGALLVGNLYSPGHGQINVGLFTGNLPRLGCDY